jgi:hypothetical protein
MFRTDRIRTKLAVRLVAELEQGTPFRTARKRAGVSLWQVFIWCLRGRRRYHNSPFAPQDGHTQFLLALAGARQRTQCNLGPVLNRLVGPFEWHALMMSQHA